jgi:hypothetical protein
VCGVMEVMRAGVLRKRCDIAGPVCECDGEEGS